MAERILIAEEDDGLREALAFRLRQGGNDVRDVSDTQTAAEILAHGQVDVAVIGLTGFENDGLELLKKARSAHRPPEVILLVGKHQGSLAIRGMKLGAFRDAQLPIHVESLRQMIREACRARRKKSSRKKRRLIEAWPKIFAAVTFAEAGEPETAKELQGFRSDEDEEE
jgi:DNA-binding NtrC family response regulator